MRSSHESAVSWCEALEARALMSFTYVPEALDLSAMLGTERGVTVVGASEQTTFLLGRMGDADYALFGPDGATLLTDLGADGESRQPIDVNERGDVLFHGRLWLNESGTADDPTGRFARLEELVTRIDAPIELGAIELDSLRLHFIADDRSIVLSTANIGDHRLQESPPQVWRLRGGVLTFLWDGPVYDIASDGSIAGARRTEEGRWQGVIARVDGTIEVTPGFIPTAIDASGVMAGVDFGGWGYVRDGERSRPLGQRFALGHTSARRPWEVNARGDVLIGHRHRESAFAPLWGRFGRVPLVAFGAPMSYETAIALDDQGAVVSGRSQTPYRLTVTDIDLTFALEPGADTLAGAFDDFVVAGVDQSGQPVRFTRGADGEWTASTELSVGASDQPGVGSGALVDPESGWRLAFTDGEGDLWVTSTFRNLSEDDPPLAGNVVVVRDWRKAIGAIARDAAGDLRAYRILRGALDSVVFPKEPINISADSLRRYEGRAPVLVGDIEVFTTAWNAIHIVGLDAAGQVWSVWTTPSFNGRWTASNMSAKAGAPALTGDLGVIVTPWGGLQISGTDSAGGTVALWWSPALGPGNWRAVNLTQAIGGPAFRAGSVGTVVTDGNALGVFGVREDTGELAVYWWAPGMAAWKASTVGGVDAARSGSLSGPISTAIGRLGEQHVAVTTDTGHLVHAFWEPGMHGWLVEDVTLLLSE